MTLPVDVYEGVIRTSWVSRLARIAARNTGHLFRNRAVLATMGLVGATLASAAFLGPVWTRVLGCTLLAVLGLWRLRRPASFRRHITLRVWGSLVSVFKYRRRWRTVLKKSGVIETFEDPPRIIRVTATKGTRRNPGSVHTVRLRMNDGHTVNAYEYNIAELTQSFNAVNGTVKPVTTKPRQLELQFIAKDPLAKPVTPYPCTAEQLFTGYPLALGDDMQPWYLKLVGTHIAVGGETGSGKGSVFWNIIMAIQPARREGLARVFGMDHKGGVELGLGGHFIHDTHFVSPFFDEFSYRSSRESVRLLDFALKEKARRQKLMLGQKRLWTPGPDGDEHILILCDEIGALTAWEGDRKTRGAAQTKLALLINQARAFGISIVYAGQDLRKDIAVFRGQTPTRLQGRTPEVWDIDNMLGPGAWRHGARADEIPDTMPGTFYCARDGKKGFARIRFGDWTDDMITGEEPEYAEDVAAAREMAEAAVTNHVGKGIERFGGFA
jgi:S-DNA-T family DNA segregation ATPase FtsK/SpoIIIE